MLLEYIRCMFEFTFAHYTSIHYKKLQINSIFEFEAHLIFMYVLYNREIGKIDIFYDFNRNYTF